MKEKKIVAIFLSIVMILGMILPSLVFPSVAKAATKTYISDLYFSSDKHNKGDCVKDLVASGVPSGNVVDHDFNCDAGGKYIYLGYKTTTDVNKAIRGLIFSGQKKDSITYNGVKYYPITNTSKDGTLDFNQDAKGDDIFLYYSKDKEAGLPITSLGAYCSEHKYVGSSTNVKVRNEKGSVQDTNRASGGNYVSLTYKYDEDSIDKSTKKTNYKVYDDPNEVPLALTLCRDWLESNRIVRDWVEVANAINTKNAVEYEGGDSYRMQVGSLININNPQMAASAITSNSDIRAAFSNSDQTTFYLKGNNAGLIFTNFQFVDNAEFFKAAADDMKKGDTYTSGELEEKGIKISSGTPDLKEVFTLENKTANEATMDSGYQNSRSTSNTLEVSSTRASEFRTDTSVGVSYTQSIECTIPFASVSASLTYSIDQTFGYTTSLEKTRATSDTDTNEVSTSSNISVNVPAHAKCSILMQSSTGEVIQSYSGACILSYDVYYIKDGTYYHFTGTSNGFSKYGSAAENVYHRAVTYPAKKINDTKQNSKQACEGTVDWTDVMSNHPLAKRAIYDLYRKVPITPYGGKLTSNIKQVTYTAGAYEPLYQLAHLKPSVTNISMAVNEIYDFEKINIDATDEFSIPWYGFYEDKSGKWEVVSGSDCVELVKNEAGNLELKAIKAGKATVRYNPSKIASSKISSNFDNKGITVTVRKGNDFQVKFVDKNGTVLKEQTVKFGQDAVPPTTPSKKGYTFAGWDKSYTKISDDLTIKAVYKPNTYTLVYNKNGGKGYMNSVNMVYDKTQTLSKPSYTRKGFLFDCWNTKPNGVGVDYLVGASVKNLTAENDGTAILYAMWEEIIESVKPEKSSINIETASSEAKIKELLAKLKITGTYADKDADDPSLSQSVRTLATKKTTKLTNNKNAWKVYAGKAVGTFKAPEGSVFANGKKSIQVTVNLLTTLSKSDQKLATYQPLLAKATKATKTSITLNWSKVAGATGYTIYNSKFVKVKDTKSTSYTVTKLKKGTFYNYTIVAYKGTKGKNTTLAVSKKIYQTTTGGSYGNAKSVKVDKSSVSLKKGKSYTLKSSEVKKDKKLKKYRALSYETSNKKIAAVSSKGKITAKKKGSCNIYVYAQNGISAKVKVTVK